MLKTAGHLDHASRRPFGRRQFLGTAAAIFGASAGPVKIRIGALHGPYATLFGFARTLAAEHGLLIDIVGYRDVETLNRAVADGEVQAGACENTQTLADANAAHGYGLANAFYAVTLPIGIYSHHVRGVVRLQRGDTIVLPALRVENQRARVLLYNYGLLRAHEDHGLSADFSNIVNPIGFNLQEAPADMLPARLADAGAVLLPYDTAIAAGLRPGTDSIGLEDGHSPYAGALIVRAADLGAPWIGTLKHVFQSRPMRQFIYENYGDSVQPPW